MASTTSESTSKSSRGYTMGYSHATTSSHASRTMHTDAAFVIPHIKPHHKILDVGCGPGTITAGFADLVHKSAGGSVTGVDSGLPVIEAARSLHCCSSSASSSSAPGAGDGEGRDNDDRATVTFEHANVLDGLPFPDNTFDVVFTSQTLLHLAPAPEAPSAALGEMRRVLKPGGFLAARDAASLTWFPYTSELHRCMTQRMFAALGTPDAAVGGKMKGLLRASGWDVSDEAMAQGRFVAGAGTTIVTGQDKCRWWRDSMGGRLRPGEQFREGWVKAGLSEEQCDEAREWLDRWAEAEDAWYGALQSEVLIWK